MMQINFDSLRNFDFANSLVYLWVFKRSTTQERFSARYAQIDDGLKDMLISAITAEMRRITEFSSYTYLAETNEKSCLTTPLVGTDFEQLKLLVDRPEPDWPVRGVRDLKNADGYVVKFIHDDRIVYAVKKSTKSWKTSYLKTQINIVFRDGELSAAEDAAFSIEKNFDFYEFGGQLFIANKRPFESSMEHRASFVQAFAGLRLKAEFLTLFTTMQPLIDYVGTNSMQLRRMARIEERAIYVRPGFLNAVRQVSERRDWGINFDPVTGQVVPSDDTIKTIIEVLLDHRLLSEVTDLTYVAPDVVQLHP